MDRQVADWAITCMRQERGTFVQYPVDPRVSVCAFEQIKHTDEQGEYWLARELGQLLGYDGWRNFLGVIREAMEVCRVQGGTAEGVNSNG